jgi:diguanylate cyclase (GGDEF)-like protein
MSDDPFERSVDIEQAQLSSFARSIAEVEWLLLVLVMLYLFVSAPEFGNQIFLIGTLIAFAGLVLTFQVAPGMRERTIFKITLEILGMVAFITAVLSQIGGEESPILSLYLLPIIASALALGKRATVLVVLLVCVCYVLLAVLRGGVEVLSLSLASQAMGVLAPFFLVAFLTSMLAENIQTAMRRIRSLSDRDELTNVYNIGAFMRLAHAEHSRAIRLEREYSLLMVDVDGLKELNDKLGHSAGNRALVLVADSLIRVTRSEDLVARYGGDEFILVLPGIEQSGAEDAAQRIRNVVYASTLEAGPTMVRVNVSVGTATYPADGNDIESLMKSADRTMYVDKEMRKKPSDQLVVQKA